ncbi:MAG: hypothetical protein P8Y04_09785 [Desulfobulbaceae bacterium]
MIYNNLLYFITAIIIFSTGSIPDEPRIPFAAALFIFVLKGAAYHYLVHHAHAGGRALNDKGYFAVEQKFSFLAIFIFAIDVYVLVIKYYLSFLSLKGLDWLTDTHTLLFAFVISVISTIISRLHVVNPCTHKESLELPTHACRPCPGPYGRILPAAEFQILRHHALAPL